jgi:hypothetical protein
MSSISTLADPLRPTGPGTLRPTDPGPGTLRPTAPRLRHALHLTTLAAALAAALAAILAATTPGPARAATLPVPSTPGGQLTVAYDDGSGHRRTYDLACAGSVGATEACRRLQEIGGPVGPVPPGQACSMIYGGPQTAEVAGEWDGRGVRESYRRTNGCEVARWSRMLPVLPRPASRLEYPALQG